MVDIIPGENVDYPKAAACDFLRVRRTGCAVVAMSVAPYMLPCSCVYVYYPKSTAGADLSMSF